MQANRDSLMQRAGIKRCKTLQSMIANLFGHPVIVEEGLIDDGVVPVEADAAQVEDGGRAQGDVHGVVHLQGMKELSRVESIP